MDLLKACQREGFVRVERDRRGGLRVFQGPALQGAAASAPVSRPNLPQPDVEDTYENQPIDIRQRRRRSTRASRSTNEEISEPIPIDTTAELLGRAKPRKPRARAPRPALGGGAEESRGEEAGGPQVDARQEGSRVAVRRRRQPLNDQKKPRRPRRSQRKRFSAVSAVSAVSSVRYFSCRGNPPTA